MIFLSILWNNVLPLSIMIALGILLQRIFALDIRTLSKLNFYLFSPAVIFDLLYTTEISAGLIGQVLLFVTVFMLLQYGLLEAVIRLRGLRGGCARRCAAAYCSITAPITAFRSTSSLLPAIRLRSRFRWSL
ncbi:hypothetical protein [Paenibacillus beijingensis]|uniref:hypothetical protein n=1 Tax=Paenibacillus beijingensis TaxID=1126833 RepID=UPI000AAAB4CB